MLMGIRTKITEKFLLSDEFCKEFEKTA